MGDRGITKGRPVELRAAVGRGQDVAVRVKDTVTEALRSRRDPIVVAHRRRLAAQRRLAAWSVGAIILAVVGIAGVWRTAHGNWSVPGVVGIVLVLGLAVYAIIAGVQAAIDVRIRTKIVRRLPPPQPDRQPVARPIRALMGRLNGYSDALRQSIGVVGLDQGSGAGPSPAMRELRDETLTAADAAETRLRRQASELSAMLRASSAPQDPRVAATCTQLHHDIGLGVDEYGRLVVAASEAVAASRELSSGPGAPGDLAHITERLTALTAGMRELIDPPQRW